MTITLDEYCPMCHAQIWEHHDSECQVRGIWYGTQNQTVLEWIAVHQPTYFRTSSNVPVDLHPTPFAIVNIDGVWVKFETHRTRAENLAELLNTYIKE